MLDWQEITAQIEHAETLSLDDLMVELADLRAKSPEIGNEITSYFARNGRVKSFMSTSAPVNQHTDNILPNGSVLGVWEIIELIGSGGMGDVYKARRSDGLYDQDVALKVIQRRDTDSLRRFEDERKRLATLEHPGISRIIDGGATKDGSPFMVMEFVEGISIDDYINAEDLTRNQSLALFRDLCASVTHAHSKLILHRDIKTTNVLVDASGAVKLIDFGIASVIGETPDGHGGPMTIAYAAPEQLLGKPPTVGSDIFALGVLLHQLLTGSPQKRNPDGSVAADKTSIGDEELFSIVSKATSFEQDKRYKSITAFSDDIDAYLDNRPVAARNGTGAYRFKKFVQRNLLASGLAAAFVVALSGGMAASLVMANKASEEAARANNELVRAEWALGRAEIREKVANSLGDSLQRVFGDEGDVNRMSATLLKHWQEVMDAPEISDDERAIISYALGDHFTSRGDYKVGGQILKPWIDSDYGDRELRISGKILMSRVHLLSRNGRDAAREVSEAAELYKGTFLENSPEHALAKVNAAYYSHKPEEFEKAKDLIKKVLRNGVKPEEAGLLWDQLMHLHLRTVDWPLALDASREAIKALDRAPSYPFVKGMRGRISLAELEFFIGKNHTLAEEMTSSLLTRIQERSGETYDMSLLYVLQALFERENGDLAASSRSIEHALELAKSHTSAQNPLYLKFQAFAVMIKADNGDFSGAREILASAQSTSSRGSDRWIATMQAYIALKESGAAEAGEVFKSANTDLKRARSYMRLNYILDEMTESGMVWE